MFLFLIAAGLSLIFGVLRVLNFAHGTFYMLGAYATYQFVQWVGTGPGRFWLAAFGGALVVAALGGVVERFLFRRLYGKEELYQLLFTYALALILSDAAKMLWGTQQKSVSRPPELTGAFKIFGAIIPHYNLFIILLGPAIALAFWDALLRPAHVHAQQHGGPVLALGTAGAGVHLEIGVVAVGLARQQRLDLALGSRLRQRLQQRLALGHGGLILLGVAELDQGDGVVEVTREPLEGRDLLLERLARLHHLLRLGGVGP